MSNNLLIIIFGYERTEYLPVPDKQITLIIVEGYEDISRLLPYSYGRVLFHIAVEVSVEEARILEADEVHITFTGTHANIVSVFHRNWRVTVHAEHRLMAGIYGKRDTNPF